MRIAVTGASGLIGSTLVPTLRNDGHEVVRLVRHAVSSADEIEWDPARRLLDPASLTGVDAVIHLAGAGVGDHRWSTAYKAQVLSSRVDGTLAVARAVAAAPDGPRVLLSASGVNFYGDTGNRWVDETAPAGTGFLADTCIAWEQATRAASDAGARVVHLRSGIVLAGHGGTLGKVLPIFRLGLGGRLGSGEQYWSWISLPDQVAAIRFLLGADGIRGPVNMTAPAAVNNAQFTTALARAVHRPAAFVVPGLALRLALGDFAQEAVLAGPRVRPGVLNAAGFSFAHADIDSALAALL